jgi:hypothetical protein
MLAYAQNVAKSWLFAQKAVAGFLNVPHRRAPSMEKRGKI